MITHTLEPIIREHPFFQGLEDRYIQLITGCASNVRFEGNQVVFREGEEANQFYLLREGLISLEISAPPRGFVTVETIREGEVLGWSWLFPPYRWRFSARTLQPTRAVAFDGKCLRAKCDQDHDLGYELFNRFSQVVTERLQATRMQLLDLYGTHD
jgi:CRP-like cAMP-binding protein